MALLEGAAVIILRVAPRPAVMPGSLRILRLQQVAARTAADCGKQLRFAKLPPIETHEPRHRV